ncbi:MAG: PDZ domain-containing protein [Planctomycetes bacterium]|nr:PDZ domain-containing protein [Planctomycetota bacterium]
MKSSFLTILLLLPACVTYEEADEPIGGVDYELVSRTAANGDRETVALDFSAATGDCRLRVESESGRDRPSLGLRVIELDHGRAQNRGVQPFSGLLVSLVAPDSGAARAGVEAGDVLLAVGAKETVYGKQLAQIEEGLGRDQVVTVRVLRGQTERELQVTVDVRRERERHEEFVPLESGVQPQRPYAGVHLRGVPTEWCRRIWGDGRNAVVVTAVVAGSPAWIAGFRAGDVIEAVDGGPVPPVADLTRLVAQRGERGEPIDWRVRRRGEAYEATLEPYDYSGESNVWIPFVFRLRNGVRKDVWTVGPLGLVVANRNEYLADTSTRATRTRNVFHALLGLIRVETTPDETDVRLLWLIHFDT